VAAVDDLIGFLRAQLDCDERLAREAGEAMHGSMDWQLTPIHDPDYGADVTLAIGDRHLGATPGVPEDGDPITTAEARFLDAHDPARVLREVQSKRLILDLADKTRGWTQGSAGATAGYATAVVVDALRALALPYADRPGYLEQWRC
jgi:hypothetical protein